MKSSTLTIKALIFSIALLGCEPKQNNDEPREPMVDTRAREDVDALIRALPELLDAHAFAAAKRISPATSLAEGSKRAWGASMRHEKLLQQLYTRRDDTPLWVNSKHPELTDDARVVLERLRQAEPVHGLFAMELSLPEIERRVAILDAPVANLDASAIDEPDRARISTWLQEHGEEFSGDKDNSKLVTSLIDARVLPAPIIEGYEALTSDVAARAAAADELEVLLSDGFVGYAREMRLDNPAWFRDFEWPEHLVMPRRPKIRERARIEREQNVHAVLHELSPVFAGEVKIEPFIDGLPPRFEQYERLLESYAHYQKIVAQGGWGKLPESVMSLKLGQSREDVVLLKERLRAEFLWSGDSSQEFTKELRDAINAYQQTHQVWEKGIVTRETWRSMNVPATRRLQRIRRSLQNWREMRIGDDTNYVYINIPDFHGEVWLDDKRELRFKVVTGSAKREYNKEKREFEMPRATELFSDTMEYMVFNPYWNVPKGIVEEEIMPELEEDPEYLETHNYEWHETSVGNRVLRQKPGPDNALGLVKFLFPNEHDIYLHDTNQKGFFRYPIRAFSHGCVRVFEPMKLARFLLEREGKLDEKKIAKWTEPGGGEIWIKLDKPLAVHIEYVVVRVDDRGRTHFLADVYRRDHEPMTTTASRQSAYDIAASAMELAEERRPTL